MGIGAQAVGKRKPVSSWSRFLFLAVVMLALVLPALVACDSDNSNTTPDPLGREKYGGQYASGMATGDTQAGASFAQWVLDQDPEHKFITDAVVRNEDSLGIKVKPNTMTNADVQRLLMALTLGMARTFRDKPLTVIAFYASGDQIAEADYNNQTGKVDVVFDR